MASISKRYVVSRVTKSVSCIHNSNSGTAVPELTFVRYLVAFAQLRRSSIPQHTSILSWFLSFASMISILLKTIFTRGFKSVRYVKLGASK